MTAVIIEYDVPVLMRDGVVLRADVYRPTSPGPWPVVVARTPYDKGELSELSLLDPWTGVRRGLIAVVQDVRGRYASEGSPWVPLADEATDGEDTVARAATLPGSSGGVGMWGLSYMGAAQWAAASRRPEALMAVAPSFTWHRPSDGLTRRGGARELGSCLGWVMLTGFDVLMRRHREDGEARTRDLASLIDAFDHLRDRTYGTQAIENGPVGQLGLPNLTDDMVGDAGDSDERVRATQVPSLNVGGWFDIFLQGSLDNFVTASRVPGTQLVIGPGTTSARSRSRATATSASPATGSR